MNTINIPVGTSNFTEIRRKGSYFVDKSGLIGQLLKTQGTKLMDSDRIHPLDKEQFHRIAAEKADLKDIKNSLVKLTQLMELYHEKPVILLIDEYDVPRQYAKKVKHDGYKNVVALGVAFFQKKCLVKKAEVISYEDDV